MLWQISDVIRWAVGTHGILALALTSDVRHIDSVELPSAESISRTALLSGMEGDVMCRELLLRCALLVDSDCELARWHLGQLHIGEQWTSIDQAENLAVEDLQYQQYRLLRNEASAHWKRELALARWCRRRQSRGAAR